MIAERGERVLAVDLDPQANLTSMFVSESQMESIWDLRDLGPSTIFAALRPILRGIGDVLVPYVEPINPRLGLLAGDLELSAFEDKLSTAWPNCQLGDEAAFRTMTAFHRAIRQAAASFDAEWILIDVGPNLGAINRAALIASERVVIPLGPDLFSLQGLRNLGPTLRSWRTLWRKRLENWTSPTFALPQGEMKPLGYLAQQHSVRLDR